MEGIIPSVQEHAAKVCKARRKYPARKQKGDQQKSVLQHMELYSMSCASLDGSRVWGAMDVWQSLHCYPETITVWLTGYTPTQNVFGVKKNKVNKKKVKGYQGQSVTYVGEFKTKTQVLFPLLLLPNYLILHSCQRRLHSFWVPCALSWSITQPCC